MGKTQLALEAARRHLDSFPDGVFMISLAQVSDARNIALVMGSKPASL